MRILSQRLIAALVSLATLGIWAPTALAQPDAEEAEEADEAAEEAPAAANPASTAARAERVQRFVDIATRQFKAGDFESALFALRDAEGLAEGLPAQAVIRYNVARVFEEMGKPDAAIAAYEAYLETADTGDRRIKAREALERLSRQRSGQLEIDCGGIEATVIVEGFPEGECPWSWNAVAAGSYGLRVLAEGYRAVQREVVVEPGQATRLMLTLQPLKAAARPKAGPGPWPWVAAGVGVAAVGAGVAFHLQAMESLADAEALGPGRKRDRTVESYESQRLFTYVGYGVGVAALGVATWLLLGFDDGSQAGVVAHPGGLLVRF